jgi:hypothetical protein
LIHGPDSSHMTNECQTMREQAYWMKEAWKKHISGRTHLSEMQMWTTKAKRAKRTA